ncbi:Protein of unknown function [Bacillus mycoides]|nr:Protein of unknown function [Bacillus mycoides]
MLTAISSNSALEHAISVLF